MATDKGENLLNPGKTPHANAQFLVFCCAVVRAVHRHAALLRMSVCGAANDHRLGANEAPPAIISVFLGRQFSDIFEQIENGGAKSAKAGGHIQIGVSMLPQLPRDAGDRNRTSPFAFTGNKFEFRAVGSSQSIAGPNTVLNTIVAESLDYVATELEKAVKVKTNLNAAVQNLLSRMIKEFKPVLFDGDNYSSQWHAEAARRGLPNLRTTVDAVPLAISKQAMDLFPRYGVYSERELHSRYEILLETYNKTIHIEAQTAILMARTMILPAALRYQIEIGEALDAARKSKVSAPTQLAQLKELVKTIEAFQKAIAAMENAVAREPNDDVLAKATYFRDKVLTQMSTLRSLGDKLELMVADKYWPMPTYREMLFVR